MVALPPSAYALKRAVAGFGPELAPILSLEMAAEDVQATRRKHATRKPVQVCRRNFRVRASSLSLSSLVTVAFHFRCLKVCLEVLLVVKILTAALVVCLLTRFVVNAGIQSCTFFLTQAITYSHTNHALKYATARR